MVSDPSSAGLNTSDLISGVNTGGLLAAKQAGGEIAKLQIQYNLMLKENNLLREKQERLIDDARLLKVQLEQERKNNKDLKTEKANFYSRRNELEELFLKCVDETRRDIERRRAVTLSRHKNLNSTLHKNNQSKFDDSLETAMKNDQFTASDKRKVLELLLSNENVLLFLYEKLFPRAMTTSTLINKASNSYGCEPNLSANIGFRPQTASAQTVLKMPQRLNSKSQKLLRNSIAGNKINFRHMSSSSNLGNPNDAITATGTVASRSNSGAGFTRPRVASRGSNSVFRHTTQGMGPGYMTGGAISNSQAAFTTGFNPNSAIKANELFR